MLGAKPTARLLRVGLQSPSRPRGELVVGSQRGYDFALEHGIEAVIFSAGTIRMTPGLSSSFGMS